MPHTIRRDELRFDVTPRHFQTMYASLLAISLVIVCASDVHKAILDDVIYCRVGADKSSVCSPIYHGATTFRCIVVL